MSIRSRSSISICLAALTVAGLVVWQLSAFHTHGKKVILQLSRSNLEVLEFLPKKSPPLVILLFASGDGGWRHLEEAISHGLQKHGCEVIGIDSTLYARTDYDLATLQADFGKIARSVEQEYGDHPLPLLVGGYSMGAAQAIAVAGGPNPPAGLVGLLLIDPLSRGRYGLREEDKINVLPRGPGTFSVAEFSRTMGHRILQWHAANDSIDSRAWLADLTVPHQECDFPGTGHCYRDDRRRFVGELNDSVDWLLKPDAVEKVVAKTVKP
jgi:hypothetical protein